MTRGSNSRVAASRARTILHRSPARTRRSTWVPPNAMAPSKPGPDRLARPTSAGVLSGRAPRATPRRGRRGTRSARPSAGRRRRDDLIVADGLAGGPRPRPRVRGALPARSGGSPSASPARSRPERPRDRRPQPRPAGRAPRGVGQPRGRQRGRRAARGRASPALGALRPPRSRGPGRRFDAAHARRGRRLERRGPDSARRRARPPSARRGRRAAQRPRGAGVGPGPALAPVPRPVPDGAALLEPHRVVSLRAPAARASILARSS